MEQFFEEVGLVDDEGDCLGFGHVFDVLAEGGESHEVFPRFKAVLLAIRLTLQQINEKVDTLSNALTQLRIAKHHDHHIVTRQHLHAQLHDTAAQLHPREQTADVGDVGVAEVLLEFVVLEHGHDDVFDFVGERGLAEEVQNSAGAVI